MKRIIVTALFAAHVTGAIAGQAGSIDKSEFSQFNSPKIDQNTIDKNWQPDFDKLKKAGMMKPNQLLVKFKVTGLQPAQAMQGYTGFKSIRDIFNPVAKLTSLKEKISSWKLVTLEDGAALANKFVELKNDPNIEYVAPNLRLQAQGTPTDLSAELWGLNNTGATIEYVNAYGESKTQEATAGVDIDAQEAWDIRTDASDVVVAVIDSGIDYNHSDLSKNTWTNPGEIPGNGIDDDGNGYIDDVHGYDFVNRDGDPMDDFGHGTHCAGTIAASANDGGVVGVAWSAQLMGIKILDENGGGYTSDIVEGILYAADNGAKVSNNSYGMLVWDSVFAEMALKPYRDAIQAAGDSGMLFAAAAGNSSLNLDNEAFTIPGSLNIPNVISVAAIDPNSEFAEFSNRGYHHTDIAAPGVAINSTLPGNQYGFYGGTSMATPHVAGVAALMKAEAPQLSAYDIKSLIMNSAEITVQQTGLVRSNGILNAKQALQSVRGGNCPSFTATNSQHETEGRAYTETTTEGGTCWGTFCWGGTTVTTWYAQGSGENLGTSGATQVTLTEKSAGHFVTDGICDAALDIPPAITLEGRVEDYVAVGDTYTLPSGYSASDAEDGDLTASVQVTNSVNTSAAGNYLVKYQVTDSAGNTTVETRLVHVIEDSEARLYLEDPICTFMGPCRPSTTIVNQPYVDPGYYAYDVLQGDLTHTVVMEGEILDNLDRIGNSGIILYTGTDLDGNTFQANVFRAVYVVDANAPLIIKDPDSEYFHTFETYRRDETEGHPVYEVYLPNAIDHVDGLLNDDDFTVDNPVDYSVAGDYLVTFTVTDSEGYESSVYSRVQVIEDITPPEAMLYCDENISVELNSDPGKISRTCAYPIDDLDPNPVREVTGSVDTSVAGDYEITYRLYDASGNESLWIQTVSVVDGATPVIENRSAIPGPRTLTVSGTAYDADSNIEKIEIKLHHNETDWVIVDGIEEWSYTYEDIDPANYTIYIRVTDSTGLRSDKHGTKYQIGGIKVWDPLVDSIDYTINGNDVTVFGTASDVNGDLDYVKVRLVDHQNGGVSEFFIADGTYSWSYDFVDLAKGDYRVNATAFDVDGNYAHSDSLEFTVGMNPPSIDSFEVTGGEQTVTVTGTASDVDGDLSRVLIGVGDSDEWHLANGTYNFSLTLNGVESGIQQVRIWVLDAEDQGVVEVTTVDVLPASCEDFSATLSEHESAGRVYSETTTEGETCYGAYCFGGTEVTRWYAVGSAEELGTNASTVVTLKEDPAGSGNYVQGACPVDPQPPVIESYQVVENTYAQAVITGVASDVNGDIDYVVLGLGAASGIICEGKENFTCTLDYEEFGFEVGKEIALSVAARDLRGEYSNVKHFTLVRPEQQEELCFTDTNVNHEVAGRAYLQYNVLYYANGSDAYLGQAADVTSLQQQGQPGNWVKVSSCQ